MDRGFKVVLFIAFTLSLAAVSSVIAFCVVCTAVSLPTSNVNTLQPAGVGEGRIAGAIAFVTILLVAAAVTGIVLLKKRGP